MLNRLRDVFRSFQQHDVKYVVIGGIASVLYGVPRATFDMDILIEATPDNAERLLHALLDAGLGTAALTSADDLLTHEITIFKDRVRIDVQTSTPGLGFKEAWDHRQTMSYEGQQFYVVSREDLIRSKRAAGRDIDLSDVRLLESGEQDSAGETGANAQQ
jgi:predicted nucleotidyltransferase